MSVPAVYYTPDASAADISPEQRLIDLLDIYAVPFKQDILAISKTVLNDPRFALWSAASKPEQHHYGKGGLAKHTLEVVELCLLNNEMYNRPLNTTPLVLAAVFHDIGKLWDYAPVGTEYQHWQATPHKTQTHHISRSALVWMEAVTSTDLFHDIKDEVLHVILAHHGRREWGSPVLPETRTAWLLHLCDHISAKMYLSPG